MKNIQLSLVCFTVCLFLYAGSASAQWARSYGTTEWESVSSVQQTSDDGYVVAGNATPSGGVEFDFWVMKLTAAGAIQWQKLYGGTGNDPSPRIQQTSDGGYIVAGYTNSFGAGLDDCWILKMDSAGVVQWQKTYGGTGTEWLNAIRQTTDGGYIAVGGTNSFGAGDNDFWILKLSSSGSVQWQRTYGGTGSDWANSVDQTSEGGYVIAGVTNSFTPAANNALIVNIDATGGVILWSRNIGSAGSEYAASIQQTQDGGYVFAGSVDPLNNGNFDVWVVKLNSSAAIQWQKSFGGAGYDIGNTVRQTPDSGFIISAMTLSFGAGLQDGWLLKLASNGSIQWQKTYGGTGDDYLYAIPTSDGGFMAAGTTESFGALGPDAWLLKLTPAGLVDPSCALGSDTLVTPANTNASDGNPTPSSVPGTVNTIQDTSVVPVVTDVNIQELCAPACLFCDDFEDGILASDWAYLKPAWTESNGDLIATPTRKAVAVASPAFAGCGANCSFEAGMKTAGGTANTVWMLAWYTDKNNTLEVLMKQENGKFVLKQKSGGSVVAKAKGLITLAPNVTYTVRVTFDGTFFTLVVDGQTLATMPAAAVPNGTVGFQAKNTTARFDHVRVE